ncbi:MAG TPA: cytochrome c peroxidase [Azospirillaceae bacterium]|nr:cytochrome c peroxidase [Azospirillaceae bacterium]
MPKTSRLPLKVGTAALAAALLLALSPAARSEDKADPFAPLPEAPKINEARAKLGEKLFFDPRLSGDTQHSCSSCHDPAKGWGDGQALSMGYTGVEYFRNAPPLFNVAGRKYLMWDGRLDGADLGTLVRDMLTEAHTMNADTRMVQERLKQVPEYVELFDKGFGGDPYGGKIYGAVAEYLKTIRTTNAPFDRHLKGDKKALNEAQARGMKLFAGKAGCASCHNGPLLTDQSLHALGVAENPMIDADAARQTTMLRHFATMGTPNYMNLRDDVGNYVVSKDSKDLGKFITPSLWDIGQTAPYMHNGTLPNLEAVINFYNQGGGTHPNKDERLKPLNLSKKEKADLAAFLKSLTGDKPTVAKPALPEYGLRTVGKN